MCDKLYVFPITKWVHAVKIHGYSVLTNFKCEGLVKWLYSWKIGNPNIWAGETNILVKDNVFAKRKNIRLQKNYM